MGHSPSLFLADSNLCTIILPHHSTENYKYGVCMCVCEREGEGSSEIQKTLAELLHSLFLSFTDSTRMWPNTNASCWSKVTSFFQSCLMNMGKSTRTNLFSLWTFGKKAGLSSRCCAEGGVYWVLNSIAQGHSSQSFSSLPNGTGRLTALVQL